MNGAWKEKREAEKGIKEYIQASGMGLSKKEEQDFKALVLQNEEAARKVFRDSNHVGKGYILIFLNSEGKGTDIAKEEAAAWVSDGELRETQMTNYFSNLYPIDCAVLSVNAQFYRKYGTLPAHEFLPEI